MIIRPKYNIILAIVFIFALIAGVFILSQKKSEDPIACTMEAKLCSDGSSVGRTGPNCEFAACPIHDTTGWKIFSDTVKGFTFKYPETFGTIYMHPQDWPPQVAVSSGSLSCTEAGSPQERAGGTTQKVINGRIYCVTVMSEGAAGSVYTEYAYATEMKGKVVILTFTTKMVQCGNYDDPQKTACEAERASFDIDSIVHTVVQTISL